MGDLRASLRHTRPVVFASTWFPDIAFRGPPRRTVKVLGVFRKGLGAREIQKEKEGARCEGSANDNAWPTSKGTLIRMSPCFPASTPR